MDIPPRAPSGLIDDNDFIVRTLLAAMTADGYLEVGVEEELEGHVCLLLSDPAGQSLVLEGEAPYVGGYLREGTHLLISALVPAADPEILTPGRPLFVRFWDQLSGLEARVSYLGEARYQGLVAHRLSFPHQLKKYKNRHALRARVVGDLVVRASLRWGDDSEVSAKVLDIHEQGLSLEWVDPHGLKQGQEVAIELFFPAAAPLFLTGVVRFITPVDIKPARCGIVFQALAVESAQELHGLVIQVGEYWQLYLRRQFADYLEF